MHMQAPAPVPHAGYHFDGTNRRFFEVIVDALLALSRQHDELR